jgi:hypothetical protein
MTSFNFSVFSLDVREMGRRDRTTSDVTRGVRRLWRMTSVATRPEPPETMSFMFWPISSTCSMMLAANVGAGTGISMLLEDVRCLA